MATYLFNSISEVQSVVGGAVNASMELSAIGPTMFMVAEKNIIPWLGQDTWDDLVDGVENTNLTAEETTLLPYVQRPLAMLTLYEYAKIGGIQFSGKGFIRTETENEKSAYKYQENQYKDFMLHNGWDAIEIMLAFLELNEDDYTDWAASEGYTENKSCVINNSRIFHQQVGHSLSRFTFEILRPLIKEIEILSLIKLLGEDQYNDIKAKILAKTIAGDDAALLKCMQKPVALFTMAEAIKRNLVQLKGNDVVQYEALEPQSYRKDTKPTIRDVDVGVHHFKEFGNRQLSYLKKYLDDNTDTFTLYAAYLEELAELEAAASTTITERCETLIGGYYEACGRCVGACSCNSTTTKKGIIKL